MVLPLASRFAVLSVDDDDDKPQKSVKNPNKKRSDGKQPVNQQSKQKQDPKKKTTKKVESQVSEGYDLFNFMLA